jgi:hypothetical protein
VRFGDVGGALHRQEPHAGSTAARLNWLRARVLANPLHTIKIVLVATVDD